MAEAKNRLVEFLQKHCKRPLTKVDVVYTASKYGMQYQAIVKLNCLNGQEYAGHLAGDQKMAEKSAATQALAANAALVDQVNSAPKDKKRQAPKQLTPQEHQAKKARVDAGEVVNHANTPKMELNSLAMRIVKRYLQKGETLYVCNKIGMQYQATVQITAFPDEWGKRAWAGHMTTSKQKAEQSAAEQALNDLRKDPKLQEEAAKPKGKGKGKGGGGYPDMWEMMEWMWGGSSWGGGYDEERKRVSENVYTGTVTEWKGAHGWLKSDLPIEHEAATMREGKIYVGKNDFTGTHPESLAAGQKVKFKLYADGRGLGAEEASLM